MTSMFQFRDHGCISVYHFRTFDRYQRGESIIDQGSTCLAKRCLYELLLSRKLGRPPCGIVLGSCFAVRQHITTAGSADFMAKIKNG